jgi:hypothetical protein
LGQNFADLWDEAKTAFGAIKDAMMRGDWQAAANILWAFLKVAWAHGVAALKEIWGGFKTWMLGVLIDARDGALAIWENMLHGIAIALIETVAFMEKAWMGFKGVFSKDNAVWQSVKQLFGAKSKEATAVDELFRSGRALQGGAGAAASGLVSPAASDLMKIEAKRKQERAAEELLFEKNLSDIGQKNLDDKKAVADAGTSEIDKAMKELAAAQAEFSKAVGENAKDDKKKEAAGLDPNEWLKKLKGLGDDTEALQQKMDVKADVAGTFNAYAVSGLGVGDSIDRIADATERTAEGVEDVREAIEDNALAFA